MAAGDYHMEGESGEYLGNFPMDVWVGERTPQGVIKALRDGHAVAWRALKGLNFRLSSLYLDDASGSHLLPGDEALVSPDVVLHVVMQGIPGAPARPGRDRPVKARLIVDGQVARVMTLHPGVPFEEALHLEPGAHVVRLDIPWQWVGGMIANPFLLRVR